MQPLWHPSPNFGPRRDGLTPRFVVIHYTAMTSAEAALKRLCLPEAEVSAHYLIGADGKVWQMVREEDRAWHAGAGEWRGLSDLNSRSVGIELDNTGATPFAQPQMVALEVLLRTILARWEIPPENVIGHSDMAPGRKIDPGPRFDWKRLERQGLAATCALDVDHSATTAEHFSILARSAGYTADIDDDTLLAAVRLRHRPYANGPLEQEDVSALIDSVRIA
ncbi:N-acetylmuramoyl-L-alanine amidase [Ruegeria sp. 2012CJ41-6]|uniref:N-acetylmuramoyl-L-alanine amidase n=1 Tax=Ruegeria spongiae TaxID=2942209 RepID=A0ABT0Q040_9RHOB|nr:N-acetylmuramoyl-L-alanine amidase [Ruegeria spongiae]MCL6283214.1 N-acetylmuramoyl-L-alanine amidase [Ruegeria spongiae]